MKSKLTPFTNKITALFKQGLTPKELVQSLIASGLISIIPVIGVSTFMITTLSLKRKLNLPVMLALSYLMWPVQILLILPFIKAGEFIFSVPSNNHTLEEIMGSFQNGFFKTLHHLSFELLCGLGGWLCTAVPVALVIYLLMLFVLKMIFKSKTIV
ncbi:DUF2062 domain-containing protein [Flavobacterium psychrotolerans]|uniref:DUF2062 domain-containing protein n=1 Tax=Flavobacterium psychrotolerans TaxID=2169410 RepID=A0A2U1JKT8_9FLAO|nr:DUF2062 domain-containing protein [Flavobacterium psychrotolerans]PWA05589.1 DUF2062 domain-containing protein [Flavobacterium psychrotolerans]